MISVSIVSHRHGTMVARLVDALLALPEVGQVVLTLNRPDWVAGLFILVRAPAYQAVGGFDEDYFLHYEDVGLCARLWAAGHPVALDCNVSISHDAQYRSHRDPIHFLWHVGSLLRYLRKHQGGARRPQ
ncbi:glycosyltransferase family 2 protein [Alkalilimnicola ehrlichii MLHE-1]|uniref:glycosyltransferase family 2 protein n=1 Tax=Alkalilimnicola ehrlichii TaxID=351052 RepID=UPI00005DCA5F|nr:hypothetical protein [Alkalilimnicola ehrlichii]